MEKGRVLNGLTDVENDGASNGLIGVEMGRASNGLNNVETGRASNGLNGVAKDRALKSAIDVETPRVDGGYGEGRDPGTTILIDVEKELDATSLNDEVNRLVLKTSIDVERRGRSMVARVPFPGSGCGEATPDVVACPNVVASDPQTAELDRAKRSPGVEKFPMTG